MGQVYFAIYREDPQMGVVAIRSDALLDPAEVRLEQQSPVTAVGSGWSAYPQLAAQLTGRGRLLVLPDLPAARDVAALAGPLFRSGRIVRPEHALPNYLRDQVASIPGQRA
jgi:tRNA threonylcarbamoyladenosine biosynthesis protein TsaB